LQQDASREGAASKQMHKCFFLQLGCDKTFTEKTISIHSDQVGKPILGT
jgi:hypothetical protein